MGDKSTMSPEVKHQAAISHLHALISDLHSITSAMEVLVGNPGPDAQHFYAESVRLAATATDMGLTRRDHLIELAAREPDRVSFPRLAGLANVSVNTIRNKLGLNPGSEPKRVSDTPSF